MPPLQMSPRARLMLRGSAVILLSTVIPIAVGCDGAPGGESAKSPKQAETESKVQALMKEGKSLNEIRAIMRGEPLTKKGAKKAGRKH